MFYGGVLITIQYLQHPDTITVWGEHCHAKAGQGLQLTIGLIHHIGLLICLFDDWLDAAEKDPKYCQPFMVFKLLDNSGQQSKWGHVLAVKRSVHDHLEDNFAVWEAHFSTTFSPASMRSMQYIKDKAITFSWLSHCLPYNKVGS